MMQRSLSATSFGYIYFESTRLALEANGYTNVNNILGGFEGGTDTKGYRTKAAGWKNLGLPYTFGFTGNIDESVPGN